jgi:hypothetical protein
MSLLGLPLLLPLNCTGGFAGAEGMGLLTMGNIGSRDPRLIAHIAVTVVYSLLVYGIIYFTYRTYYLDRIEHLNSKEVTTRSALSSKCVHACVHSHKMWSFENRSRTTPSSLRRFPRRCAARRRCGAGSKRTTPTEWWTFKFPTTHGTATHTHNNNNTTGLSHTQITTYQEAA